MFKMFKDVWILWRIFISLYFWMCSLLNVCNVRFFFMDYPPSKGGQDFTPSSLSEVKFIATKTMSFQP